MNDKSQVKCFLCDDGSTTLYCLNCAGDLLDKHLAALQSQLTQAHESIKAFHTLSNELDTKLAAANKENSTLRACIKDDCENEEWLKQEALKVLPEIQVNGDRLGVPGVAGIGENLVARIKVLDGALKLALGALEWRPIDTAPKDGTRILVCSGGGTLVEVCRWTMERWMSAPGDYERRPSLWLPIPPIEAIKACGVEL